MDAQWEKYENIVCYGIGQYYEIIKKELFRKINLTYLCDRKWDGEQINQYDDVPIIPRKQLLKLKNVLIIVAVATNWTYEAIKSELESLGLTVVHVDQVIGKIREIDGQMLKRNYPSGMYQTFEENIVYFDETLPDNVRICFTGKNNCVRIDKNLRAGKLVIKLGNNGICKIGKNTEIVGASLYISDAQLTIGDDCLFSAAVIIRTHDGHHIFDLNTHQRINDSSDVIVKDNVWVGHRVTLLGGAQIGTGSVVGANSVTSGQFGEHQIVAGSPARCIRENIFWSKDSTDCFNRRFWEECQAQEASKYL